MGDGPLMNDLPCRVFELDKPWDELEIVEARAPFVHGPRAEPIGPPHDGYFHFGSRFFVNKYHRLHCQMLCQLSYPHQFRTIKLPDLDTRIVISIWRAQIKVRLIISCPNVVYTPWPQGLGSHVKGGRTLKETLPGPGHASPLARTLHTTRFRRLISLKTFRR